MAFGRTTSDFIWLVVSNATRALGQFSIVLILSATSGLAASGEYAYALALTAPTFMLLELGLRNIYVSSPQPGPQHAYVLLRTGAVCLALAINVAIAQVQDVASIWLVSAVAGVKALDSLLDIFFAFAQRWGAVAAVGRISIASTAATIVVVSAASASGTSAVFAIVTAGVTSTLLSTVALSRCWPAVTRVAGQVQTSVTFTYPSTVRHGAALGTAVFAGSLVTSLPLLLVARYHASETIGAVATLLYVVTAAALVSNAAAQALLPRFFTVLENDGLAALRATALRCSRRATLLSAAAVAPLTVAAINGAFDDLPLVRQIPDAAFALTALALVLQVVPAIVGGASLVVKIFGRQLLTNVAALLAAGAVGVRVVPDAAFTGATAVVLVGVAVRTVLSTSQFLTHRRAS